MLQIADRRGRSLQTFLPKTSAPLLALLTLTLACNSWGHTRWNPDGLVKPRTTNTNLKAAPCGVSRTDSAVVLQSGATIEVEFESTIYHQGHFRIAFSEENDQGFDEHILADNIPDYPNQRYRSHTITLPDIECSACTLQLIQVMLDTNPPSDYYSCADIQLTATGTTPDGSMSPPAPVSEVLALPGDRSAALQWRNPNDEHFFRVLIAQTEQEQTLTPETGRQYQVGEPLDGAQVVYLGNDEFTNLSGLTPGQSYVFHLFSYSSDLHYGPVTVTTVDIPSDMDNIAPMVTLIAEQAQRTGTVAYPDDGLMLIQAIVTDANPGDDHSYDWSASDPRLINSSQYSEQFVFDPSALALESYSVRVTVTDNGTPPLSTTAVLEVEVKEPSRSGGAGSLLLTTGLLLAGFWRQRRKRAPPPV